MTRVAAVVLAAGRSSRFRAEGGAEETKLVAKLDGKPIVRRVVEAALASRARPGRRRRRPRPGRGRGGARGPVGEVRAQPGFRDRDRLLALRRPRRHARRRRGRGRAARRHAERLRSAHRRPHRRVRRTADRACDHADQGRPTRKSGSPRPALVRRGDAARRRRGRATPPCRSPRCDVAEIAAAVRGVLSTSTPPDDLVLARQGKKSGPSG